MSLCRSHFVYSRLDSFIYTGNLSISIYLYRYIDTHVSKEGLVLPKIIRMHSYFLLCPANLSFFDFSSKYLRAASLVAIMLPPS